MPFHCITVDSYVSFHSLHLHEVNLSTWSWKFVAYFSEVAHFKSFQGRVGSQWLNQSEWQGVSCWHCVCKVGCKPGRLSADTVSSPDTLISRPCLRHCLALRHSLVSRHCLRLCLVSRRRLVSRHCLRLCLIPRRCLRHSLVSRRCLVWRHCLVLRLYSHCLVLVLVLSLTVGPAGGHKLCTCHLFQLAWRNQCLQYALCWCNVLTGNGSYEASSVEPGTTAVSTAWQAYQQSQLCKEVVKC